MQVYPIDRSTNKNPQFSGYVHKSVVKYVKTAVKNECDLIVNIANQTNRQVEKDKIKNVIEFGKTILNKLTTYVAPMHENTYVAIDDIYNPHLYFGNIVSKKNKHPKVYTGISDKNYVAQDNDIFIVKHNSLRGIAINPQYTDLRYLNNIAGELEKSIDSSKIDTVILNNINKDIESEAEELGANLFGNLYLKAKAKKIDKFASEIGIQDNNTLEKVVTIINKND